MKSTLSMQGSNGVLNSWKEVAQYLERGVRTVQRWEADLGLPVRRPRGKKRSAVIAICSEIDDWVSSCPAFLASQENGLSAQAGKIILCDQVAGQSPLSESILRSRFLRSTVRRSRQELRSTIARLLISLKTATATNEAVVSPSSFLPSAEYLRAKDSLPARQRLVS